MSRNPNQKKRFWHPSHKHQKDLLEQKYIDLKTTFERKKLTAGTEFAEFLVQIEEVLADEHCWDNANTAEQLLANLYTDGELDCEIKLCLLEAKTRLDIANNEFFTQQQQKVDCRDSKLHLLSSLYKKLQISYDLEEQKKFLLSTMRFSTCMAFCLSIMMFFMLDNLRYIKAFTTFTSSNKLEFIISAIAAGWMGACFSMLMRLKGDIANQSIAELAATNRIDNLISRSLIGMVSGLIIFFAFEATILQGALFPMLNFTDEGEYIMIKDGWTLGKGHALLVFWCFLAGFSEKLVPDLLSKAEERAKEKGGEHSAS